MTESGNSPRVHGLVRGGASTSWYVHVQKQEATSEVSWNPCWCIRTDPDPGKDVENLYRRLRQHKHTICSLVS